MNAVHLVGRVGRKPELASTRNGSPRCNFSLAVDSYVKGKGDETIKKTTWLPLVIFGPAAVNLVSVLRQGSLVSVSGELTTRRVEDDALNTHTEVNVKVLSWQLLAHPKPKPEAQPPATRSEAEGIEEGESPALETETAESAEGDDIPF
jgi:single-strand DNA-binding protein